jgi:ornithine cyclodeaminase/alanine dehydrogenase-like protein (mu-crystallin family)
VPLLVSEADLAPLLSDPASIDSLMDVLERATVRRYEGKVRDHRFVDVTEGLNPNTSVQLSFAADDGEVCGYQVFAEDVNGMAATLPNARFITLLDPATRQLLAIVDYRSISPLRVGASGGIGVGRLLPEGARVAGILGSAQQARGQLHAIARTAPELERVRIYSPTAAHREALAREMEAWLEIEVVPVATAREAVEGSDVVAVANSSGGPILEMAWAKPGAVIVPIGGSEMPAEVLTGVPVVSTTWDQLSGREPYKSAIQAGTFRHEHVAAELAEVVLGKANVRRAPDDVVVFELGVLHIWAVAAAHWAYQWARRHGAGTQFNLSTD